MTKWRATSGEWRARGCKWSSRARRGICFAFACFAAFASLVGAEPKRPKILKIAYVRILVSDANAAANFYSKLSLMRTPEPCVWCELGQAQAVGPAVHIGEQVALVKDDGSSPENRIDETVFVVSDVRKMGQYLRASGLAIRSTSPRLDYLDVLDPEGHRMGFVQGGARHAGSKSRSDLRPIIHAGFIVRDQAAMNHFYKDILGFRPYWHGGMKDQETSWISLQVPDGTDWIEFMVNLPPNPDQHLRGVMNHIALGVVDIHATREQLVTNGVHLTEEPKLGRDGKWQLNLYDPDQTRIEFMEFTPKEKPCCSEFTGPHPKP
jgi:catechol 2,3-dioxygenase-like lactoylglutathione lyase family enzyme